MMATRSVPEDLENPTLETILEMEEEVVVVQGNDDSKKGFMHHKKSCFWIIAFVLIMIFSREVVRAFFG